MGCDARKHLFSEFLTKQDSIQSPRLRRLARKLNCNFTYSKLIYNNFQNTNIKGAEQSARMCRLVCTFVVCKPLKTGFLALRPILRFKHSHKQVLSRGPTHRSSKEREAFLQDLYVLWSTSVLFELCSE